MPISDKFFQLSVVSVHVLSGVSRLISLLTLCFQQITMKASVSKEFFLTLDSVFLFSVFIFDNFFDFKLSFDFEHS